MQAYYFIGTMTNVYKKVYDGQKLQADVLTYDGYENTDDFVAQITKGNLTHVNQYGTMAYDETLGKNVGTLELHYDEGYPKVFRNGVDVTDEYTQTQVADYSFEDKTPGYKTFTIISRDITLKSGSGNWEYDGKAHSVETVSDETAGLENKGYVSGEEFTYSNFASVTFVTDTPVDNTFSYSDSSTALTSDYNVTTQYGKLTVTGRTSPLTITVIDQKKDYDGTASIEAAKENVTYTVDGVLAYNDTLTVTLSNTKVNAGTYEDGITATYTIMHDNGDGTKTDVTSMYLNVTVDAGDLTINKRDVTITSASDTKGFDGTPLTNSNTSVTSGSFVSGEGYVANVTGSQTAIGSSPNYFTVSAAAGTAMNNYNVTKVEGTLTVYLPTETVNTRVREAVDLEDQYLVMTRRGSVAINALASETTDADAVAVIYKNDTKAAGEITLNGDIVVTDRAGDDTTGHDTYGIEITDDYNAGTNLTTDYASRTTVTRDTRSTNNAEVYGIDSNGAVTAEGAFKNTITVTATNTAKKNGGEISAYGIDAASLEVGDYAATLRVSALDKAAKANSEATAIAIRATGSAEFGTISKSIYAYASGDGATATGIDAGTIAVTNDLAGAVTVRAVSSGTTKALAEGFASIGAIKVGDVTKAVTATAQNTNKKAAGKATANAATANAFDAATTLTLGDVTAAVKATASSVSDGRVFARGLYTASGDMTVKSLKSVTATATSASGEARAEAISAKGKLTVTTGALGMLTATAKGTDKDTKAYGIKAKSLATDGVAALTGTIKAISNEEATGILISGEQAALTAAELTITAGDSTTQEAYGITFNDKAELTLKDSTIKATGTDKSYALYSKDVDKAQKIALAGSADDKGTKLTGDVDLKEGDDTLALSEKSTITGDVDLGEGENKLTMAGSSNITGDVSTGSSNDKIVLRDTASIIGNVSTGEGNDRIVVDGSATIGEKNTKYAKTSFETVDLGDGTNDTVDIFALEGARITADIVNAEMVTFHLTDMNPRTYSWVGNKLGEAEAKTAVTIDIDVSHTDFDEGKERWFTVGRDMDGGIADGIDSISVTGLGSDQFTDLTVNGEAKEYNGWKVEIKALDSNGVNTEAGSQTLFAVVTEIDPVHVTKLSALTAINNDVDPRIGTNDGEFYQTDVDLDVSITTLAGDDVLAFNSINKTWDVSNDFDMGSGNDTVTTYGYTASAENYIRNSTPNTVALTGETFASSKELNDFFDAAHVENYIGQFKVTQENGNSLTVVETYDQTKDPIETKTLYGTDDAWGTVEYTEFATQDNDLTLTKGEVKDVTGYTNLTFGTSGTVKVQSAGDIVDAKIDDTKAELVDKNIATVNSISALNTFTGTVTDNAGTAKDITATGATAEFTNFENVTSLTAGSVAGYFSSVDFNGSETAGQKVSGVITKAEVSADAKQSVTATSVQTLVGFDGTLTNKKDTAKVITATGATAKSETIDKDLFTDATITLTAGTLDGLAANTALKTVTDGNGNSVAVTNAGQIVKAEIASLDVTVKDGNEFTLGGDKSLVKSAEQTGVTVTGDDVKATIKTGKTVNLSSGNTGTATLTDVTKVQVAGQDAVTLATGNVAKSTNTIGTIGMGMFTLGEATDYKVTNDGTAKVGGNGVAGTFTDADSLTLTDGTASLADVADVTLDDDLAAAGNQGTVAGTLTGATKGDTADKNTVTAANDAMTLTGFTGTLKDAAATKTDITATDASAAFGDFDSLSGITAGSVEGVFTTALGATATTGSFEKAEYADSKVTLTAKEGALYLADGANLTADKLVGKVPGSGIAQLTLKGEATVNDVTGFTNVQLNAKDDTTGATASIGSVGDATLKAQILASDKADTLTLTGTVYDSVSLSQGDDVLNITRDDTTTAAINGGDGTDTLNINGTNTAITSISYVELVNFDDDASAAVESSVGKIVYSGYSSVNKVTVGLVNTDNRNIGTIDDVYNIQFSYEDNTYAYDGTASAFTSATGAGQFEYNKDTGALSYSV